MSNPKAALAERDRLRRVQAVADLQAVMNTPAGRRLLWRLIEGTSGAFGLSHAGESTHETAFNEGRRAVGLELMADVQREAPTLYVQMLAEEFDERRVDNQLRREAAESEGADE